jgi:hypothetical protein
MEMRVWCSSYCVQVMAERSGYHYRIQRSVIFKNSWTLVVDGAEMSRFGLPHFTQSDKSTAEGWKIPTRLYGAIVHGEFAAAYIFPAHLPGGTNVTVEVIHRTLTTLIEGDDELGIEKRKVPPTLYLQLDNTAK